MDPLERWPKAAGFRSLIFIETITTVTQRFAGLRLPFILHIGGPGKNFNRTYRSVADLMPDDLSVSAIIRRAPLWICEMRLSSKQSICPISRMVYSFW